MKRKFSFKERKLFRSAISQFCRYCGENPVKANYDYCSEECAKHDAVWRFSD